MNNNTVYPSNGAQPNQYSIGFEKTANDKKVYPATLDNKVQGQTNIGFENIEEEEHKEVPETPIYKPDVAHRGYENVGSTAATVLALPQNGTNLAIPSAVRNEFQDVPVLTEEEARNALLGYVDKKCCYGKRPVEKLTFTDLQSSSTFRYVLQTFIETRTSQWAFEPYSNQHLMNNGGAPPQPWDIPVQAKTLFVNETVFVEVPNTANVKVCHRCSGIGTVRCGSCSGRGVKRCFSCGGSGHRHRTDSHGRSHSERCFSCSGRGFKTCTTCTGSGIVTCPCCRGTTRLKWFIKLTVEFQNHVLDFIKKSEEIPDELIRNCQTKSVFSEQNQRVSPLNHHQEVAINRASQDLIQQHLMKFQNNRILAQHHEVLAIPVTLCKYKYSDKDYQYIVFGLDKQVHMDKYPASCCWCCTIS